MLLVSDIMLLVSDIMLPVSDDMLLLKTHFLTLFYPITVITAEDHDFHTYFENRAAEDIEQVLFVNTI